MTQEDKKLLLTDLCARLPHGVICKCNHTEFDEWDGKPFIATYSETLNNIDANGIFLAGGFSYDIDEIKPYLRPMSSMSEEERTEYLNACGNEMDNPLSSPRYSGIDWLNAHHFDYRGLIEKGLAIEAPKGMYN